MPVYSLKITKDKFELLLSSSDKELVSNQLEKWISAASKYAKEKRAQECKELVNTQIREEEAITKKNIEEQIAKHTHQDNSGIEKQEEHLLENADTTDKNIDVLYSAPQAENQPEERKSISSGVFDDILEKSLNAPQMDAAFKASPSIKKDNAFVNYISSRKIERKIDYLLLTAYYLTQYEQKPRFTLKQLNAKLMQNIAVIIDHSILQEAINRDYIECLPDLTGLVGASEYRLTSYGEKVLLDV